MSPQQLGTFVRLVRMYAKDKFEFHHGDCIGADAQAHYVVNSFRGTSIVIHPPVDEEHRAFCKADEVQILTPFNHLRRNRNIVDACDIMIATPLQDAHQSRGGTWYTIDYSLSKRKEVTVIYRDGSTQTRSS